MKYKMLQKQYERNKKPSCEMVGKGETRDLTTTNFGYCSAPLYSKTLTFTKKKQQNKMRKPWLQCSFSLLEISFPMWYARTIRVVFFYPEDHRSLLSAVIPLFYRLHPRLEHEEINQLYVGMSRNLLNRRYS